MKNLSRVFATMCLITVGSSYAIAGGGTSTNSPAVGLKENRSIYKIIPFSRYAEVSGLPPTLELTFQIKCFQKFVRVLRTEEVDADVVSIVVGALVREDLEFPCESAREITVDAGHTYSGRAFEVVPIRGD